MWKQLLVFSYFYIIYKFLFCKKIALVQYVVFACIGVPKFLRSDYGTENCIVASLHIAFHLKNSSGLKEQSYIYGPSKRNVVCLIIASYAYKIKSEMQLLSHAIVQRIEGWWSQLRRFKMSWWIDLLKVTSLVCN